LNFVAASLCGVIFSDDIFNYLKVNFEMFIMVYLTAKYAKKKTQGTQGSKLTLRTLRKTL
jgi:hypothetical protein